MNAGANSDALVIKAGRIAESFLQHGAEDLSSGDRQQIVIHVDAETLRDSVAGRCELEDGPSPAAETSVDDKTAATLWRGERLTRAFRTAESRRCILGSSIAPPDINSVRAGSLARKHRQP
jgi:hypothetical protein